MTNKKITKQLMAIGVQRNDAVAFARTYRRIVSAGRRDIFLEMELHVPMAAHVEAPVHTLEVSILYHGYAMGGMLASGIDVDQFIRRKLAQEMAQHLLSSPYVVYRRRGLNTGETEFKAVVRVAELPKGE